MEAQKQAAATRFGCWMGSSEGCVLSQMASEITAQFGLTA
jgi:hypothetical protein